MGVPGSWLGWTGNPLSYFNPANLAYIFSVPLDPGSYFAFTSIVIVDDLLAIMYTALFNPQGLGLVVPLAMVEIVGATIGNTIQALNYLVTQTALIPALLPALAATSVLAPAGCSAAWVSAGWRTTSRRLPRCRRPPRRPDW